MLLLKTDTYHRFDRREEVRGDEREAFLRAYKIPYLAPALTL